MLFGAQVRVSMDDLSFGRDHIRNPLGEEGPGERHVKGRVVSPDDGKIRIGADREAVADPLLVNSRWVAMSSPEMPITLAPAAVKF